VHAGQYHSTVASVSPARLATRLAATASRLTGCPRPSTTWCSMGKQRKRSGWWFRNRCAYRQIGSSS